MAVLPPWFRPVYSQPTIYQNTSPSNNWTGVYGTGQGAMGNVNSLGTGGSPVGLTGYTPLFNDIPLDSTQILPPKPAALPKQPWQQPVGQGAAPLPPPSQQPVQSTPILPDTEGNQDYNQRHSRFGVPGLSPLYYGNGYQSKYGIDENGFVTMTDPSGNPITLLNSYGKPMPAVMSLAEAQFQADMLGIPMNTYLQSETLQNYINIGGTLVFNSGPSANGQAASANSNVPWWAQGQTWAGGQSFSSEKAANKAYTKYKQSFKKGKPRKTGGNNVSATTNTSGTG